MSWFPYTGGDGEIDKFYVILYDESNMNGPGVTIELLNRSMTVLGK